VQVEPDLTVVLLPQTSVRTTMPGAKFLPLQKTYGYPVRPVFKKWRSRASRRLDSRAQ
jgi:hypothetical protein